MKIVVFFKHSIELSIHIGFKLIIVFLLLEGDTWLHPICNFRESRHRVLIFLVFVRVVEPLRAPFCNLDALGELSLSFEDQTLAMESFGIVGTFLQRPVVIDIGVIQVVHLLVAC